MSDEFLIKFALITLGAVSFSLQHTSQLVWRRISKDIARDKNITMIAYTIVMQLISIAIIIEMMNYALKK